MSKREEIKELIAQGIDLVKIAKTVGVSRQYVWQLTNQGEVYTKEYQREYQKEIRQTDEYKEWRKNYIKGDKFKKWMEDNKDKLREINRKYRLSSDNFKEYRRNYEHTEKRKKYREEYYKNKVKKLSTDWH